ncbi:MAG: FAD-dependent thymidylate synthase [Parabacteroides sp.]|nr:FAD-dependent thymidylate synthase [Parabacteroides sp.]
MNVKLLEHTPNPENLIAAAAKLCYSSSTVDELIMDNMTDESVEKFLNMLFDLGHESPIEHASFTFAIEGISRACSHQLVRHRIASYSQKSQRYVSENQFEYVTPPSIKEYGAEEIFDETMYKIQCEYENIRDLLIEGMVKRGMNRKAAEKKANEDARFVLPNACTTSIIVTMNIRSLFNFFKHRCCNRAQWEIRDMATRMWKLCMEVSPTIFKHAGPDCVTKNKCGEGKMTCGKFSEKKMEFDFTSFVIENKNE